MRTYAHAAMIFVLVLLCVITHISKWDYYTDTSCKEYFMPIITRNHFLSSSLFNVGSGVSFAYQKCNHFSFDLLSGINTLFAHLQKKKYVNSCITSCSYLFANNNILVDK